MLCAFPHAIPSGAGIIHVIQVRKQRFRKWKKLFQGHRMKKWSRKDPTLGNARAWAPRHHCPFSPRRWGHFPGCIPGYCSSCPHSQVQGRRAFSAHPRALGFAQNYYPSWNVARLPSLHSGFLRDLFGRQKRGDALWHLETGFALCQIQLLGGNFY